VGTFFASRRNQVIVAVAAILLVLASIVAYNLVRGGTPKIGVTQTGTGSVTSPSPSATDSPSPDVSPSPSLAPTPSPSSAPSAEASAAVPSTTAPAIGTAGHEMNPPAADATKPNAGPCDAWYDTSTGWSAGSCGILLLKSKEVTRSVGYVTEQKSAGSGTAWRVFLMTSTAGTWHIKLEATDESGTRFDTVDVKEANVAGDDFPEVVVGFRIHGTGLFLTYDIVQVPSGGALNVAASRNLDHGSANIESTDIVDYTPYPNASTPDYFIRSVIGFSAGAFRITDSSHAPERGPGNLAPPP
jgi:hypothetical protein